MAQGKDCEAQLHGIALAKLVAQIEGLWKEDIALLHCDQYSNWQTTSIMHLQSVVSYYSMAWLYIAYPWNFGSSLGHQIPLALVKVNKDSSSAVMIMYASVSLKLVHL